MKGTIWVALFALLVQALLSGVLHATEASVGFLGEICTASGIKKVANGENDAPTALDPSPDCLTCVVAYAPALPSGMPALHSHPPFAFELFYPPGILRNALTRASLHLRGPPLAPDF